MLKDPKMAEIFQAQVGGKFAALSLLDNDTDTFTSDINEVLLLTAEEVLGRQQKKIQPWVMNEVLNLCDRRREMRGRKHANEEAWTKYQWVHRGQEEDESSQRGVDWGVDSATKKGMETENSRQACNTLKALTRTSQSRAAVIKDKDGKLLTDSEKVQKRWTDYCNSLYNYKLCTDTSILL